MATAPRTREPRRLPAWLLAIALALPAGTQQPGQQPLTFTAPDGSRFVLIADPAVPQVHWAMATWIDGSDDPPGLEGLARAAVHAAQNGTWPTGSRDPERERRALDERDALQARGRGSPGDVALQQQADALDEQCRQLFDAAVFPRVLAAAPGHRLELHDRGPVAVLAVTTIASAIGEVGRLLVERREQQPLRGFDAGWKHLAAERAAALAADPHRALHAEVLALTMPGHAAVRSLQTTGTAWPTRSQALAAWAASQRPERTVHVLLGDFDAASAEAALRATFAATNLPARGAAAMPAPLPLAGVRHSLVPGTARPVVAIGWVLPVSVGAEVLVAATAWLGGDDGALAAELRRAGRPDCRVTCRATWPAGESRGLFLVTVEGERPDGLADAVQRAVRAATSTPPDAASLARSLSSRQRLWRQQHPTPRELVVELAAAALPWPARAPAASGPGPVAAADVQALWTGLFAGQPVIVEGRP